MKYFLPILLLCVSFSSVQDKDPTFKTEYLHPKPGKVTIIQTAAETIFEIDNDFGIGKAKVMLVKGSWPSKCTLRLNLKGLEGITVTGSGQKFSKSKLAIIKNKANGSVYFDVRLPRSLFKSTKEIQFAWVDFYR